jgi:hypothetical protein
VQKKFEQKKSKEGLEDKSIRDYKYRKDVIILILSRNIARALPLLPRYIKESWWA